MSETKHTAGAWSIERYGDGRALMIHSDATTRICFMATPGSHGDPAKIEADAHLIAAAPDMLEALINLVSLSAPHFTDKPQMLALELARAAIAKATAEGRS